MKATRRIEKLEQHPLIRETKQQKYFASLNKLKSGELGRHLETMSDQQLDDYIASLGIDDGINFDSFTDEELDHIIDTGELPERVKKS